MGATRQFEIWRHPEATSEFTTGISLHSHTSHSRENLEFIPKYARRSRFLGKVIDLANWQYQRKTSKEIDFSRAYWTPPLSPRMAMDLECAQIDKLGLTPFVSLSDHDNAQAGWDTAGPISMEWTIPCKPSFFHLGVHNLPTAKAREMVAAMNAYTAQPDPDRLPELLAMLSDREEVLVVMNHPLWDEGLIGNDAHEALLDGFLTRYGQWIHALELNGLRSAEENQRVAALAERTGLVAVSGGDRHGREPNANLNLSRAATLSDFICEVRQEKISTVLFLEQYREPLRMRQFETAWDILRYDRERDDGKHSWCDRIYYKSLDGETRPLSFYFGENGPGILLPFLAVMRLLEQPAVRPVLRAALGD